MTEYGSAGLPHSGVSGSTLDDSSPKLIAAIHALHRLLAPRHPPHALSSLIHVRRQHLIRVDSSCWIRLPSLIPLSAQLLRCHPQPLGTAAARALGPPGAVGDDVARGRFLAPSDESLAGGVEIFGLTRHRLIGCLLWNCSGARHKSARL